MTDVSVIILTYNEEKHITRCLQSLLPFTDKIFIVDSFSTDRTVEMARSMGAVVVQNAWVNYATQFNFGIEHIPFKTGWLMRMDADEYVAGCGTEAFILFGCFVYGVGGMAFASRYGTTNTLN